MKYIRFNILSYKALKDAKVKLDREPIPYIGLNESGKSSNMEAIARFDYRNDQIASARSWKFLNRYMPLENEFAVEAEIEYTDEEIAAFFFSLSDAKKAEIEEKLLNETKITLTRHFIKDGANEIIIYSMFGLRDAEMQTICQKIIQSLPRIIYFDNFLENPFPDKVQFTQAIIDGTSAPTSEPQINIINMFAAANIQISRFFAETESTVRDTLLTDVNRQLSTRIITDWKRMHVGKQELDVGANNLSVELVLSRETELTFEIRILETFKDAEKVERTIPMNLSERSQGFRWFFNFSVKKCYSSLDEGKFVYLIDEPGSYLHTSAQEVLLKAIVDLAKTNWVIFTTHSEFLLDPEIININNIKVVEKHERVIKIKPLAETRVSKKLGTLSPLYNALRMKAPIDTTINKNVIVTEGITDFYFWRMLIDGVVFLPGFGADNNQYLISLAIGTAKNYVALFDGDDEGNKAISQYTKFFGSEQANYWLKYKTSTGNEVVLETLFSPTDQQRLLTLTEVKDLKKAITLLFFAKDKQKEFWEGIDQETKNNISATLIAIKDTLNVKGEVQFRYSFADISPKG